jgi:hypothetical protein
VVTLSTDVVGQLGRANMSPCNTCSNPGHDRFECPMLFASTFSTEMSGHSSDGSKLQGYWILDATNAVGKSGLITGCYCKCSREIRQDNWIQLSCLISRLHL